MFYSTASEFVCNIFYIKYTKQLKLLASQEIKLPKKKTQFLKLLSAQTCYKIFAGLELS